MFQCLFCEVCFGALHCTKEIDTQTKPTMLSKPKTLNHFFHDLFPAWHRLQVFPCFTQVSSFPALDTGYRFSRAWHGLQVFPRLTRVTSFPALDTGYKFSCAWHQSQFSRAAGKSSSFANDRIFFFVSWLALFSVCCLLQCHNGWFLTMVIAFFVHPVPEEVIYSLVSMETLFPSLKPSKFWSKCWTPSSSCTTLASCIWTSRLEYERDPTE